MFTVLSSWQSHCKCSPALGDEKKRKGKEEYLYSAILVRMHTLQNAQTWITQLYLQTAPCLPLLRKHSLDSTTTIEAADIQLQLFYSFIDPEGMKGWVGLVGWPIADGLPT